MININTAIFAPAKRKLTKTEVLRSSLFILPALLIIACSTAPKNPGDIYDLRKQAEAQLDLGNKMSDRGNNEESMILLNEAQRLAKITDSSGLIIRTSLSRGNVLLNLHQFTEASAEFENALSESQLIDNREFIAVSRIHISRFMLLTGQIPAQKAKEEIVREMAFIKSDKLYIAFAWMARGLAEKEMGNYSEAENAVKQALTLHEKDRYLEHAAYDWYLIANFRSLSRNYKGAQEAIMKAIALDRRIENSYGLATDWRALGEIHIKAGNNKEAKAAFIRSSSIFRGLGNDEAALEVESKI